MSPTAASDHAAIESTHDGDARILKLPGLQGGSGHDSYSHNSQVQNNIFHEYGKPHLSEALHDCVSTFFSNTTSCESATSGRRQAQRRILGVADLGCSHGPNTLEHAHFIVQAISSQLLTAANNENSQIELHYFFSDLPGNDFNALFRSLQPIGPQLQNFVALGPSQLSVFGAGVPGSFYGRLFPRESLHLAICNFSLHWLSQVPLNVMNRKSEAWNGGHVWIDGGRPHVCEAYANQFQADAKSFLRSRVQELVRGGILFIVAISRSELHPTGMFQEIEDGNDFWMGDFDACWQDMVHEGLVSEEERDMFNVPHYNFHQRELETALEGLEGDLEVVKLEVLKKCNALPIELFQQLSRNREAYGKMCANMIGSLVKPLVQAHIGEERAEKFFKRLQHKTIKRRTSVSPPSTPPTYDMLVCTIRRC